MLVVEDGSGVTGANTYVDRADAIVYAADRGVTLADDATTDAALLNGMAYLNGLKFKGFPVSPFQTNAFPRDGIYLPNPSEQGNIIYGEYLYGGYNGYGGYAGYPGYGSYGRPAYDPGALWDKTAIPPDVISAQIETAMIISGGFDIAPVTAGAMVIQDTVGPLTTKYSDKWGTGAGAPDMPVVRALLKRWLDLAIGFSTVRA